MFSVFLFLALILLIAGSVGLFFTNTVLVTSNPNWFQGNLTFGTFTIIGLALIVVLTIYGSEID